MINVIIIGTGNVATHLAQIFKKTNEINLLQVIGRNKTTLKPFSNFTETSSSFLEIKSADVYIIAVSDDAIDAVSKKLTINNQLVAHTSGSVAMKNLSNKNRKGIFYPLQTFSKNQKVDFKNIPICVEAENKKDEIVLQNLGEKISETVAIITSEERKTLHLAAVFVNNFVNYMYHIGNTILEDKDISFDLLKPLISETAKKATNTSPKNAQTGPAKRKDILTIKKHLHLLQNSPYKEIYEQLSQSISEEYHKK